MIYEQIITKLKNRKLFALLIDPENYTDKRIEKLIKFIEPETVDYILVGGSLVSTPPDRVIKKIKSLIPLPVVLFPGSIYQLSGEADALLLLSLISGRNPELLIGTHVMAAPIIKKLGVETIPTGYIIIGDGKTSSVEYMSNTHPIPADKPELIIATALAGEYLGHKLIYLEHGSGAEHPIHPDIIQAVRKEISIPLVVGGGIQSSSQVKELYNAGADMIVVGTQAEKDPSFLKEIGNITRNKQ